MRTTLDIDEPILNELRKLRKREGKSLGRIVSDLLARALGPQEGPPRPPEKLRWNSRPMGARVDLDDREALWAVMEEPQDPPPRKGSKGRK